MAEAPIVVVGAGQAGLQVLDSLRRGGYDGPLTLIGDEATLPYQRPPLSKQYISGEMADERLLFRPADYYTKQNIDVRLGARVTAIDTAERTLTIEGESSNYAALALTTGASVRRLPVPGADLAGVCYLRSLADAQFIHRQLTEEAKRIVAVGGGFSGLEIAASARELGHSVTVVEALDRLMARVVAPMVSDYYLELHRSRGNEVLLDSQVGAIERDPTGALRVLLVGGRAIAADIVVVGIGSVPHTELAEAAGIKCNNGIIVDEFARTSAEDVVAAGDCTQHRNARYDGYRRLESVQNAVDQAKVAAASLMGKPVAYDQVPWFWSDQFEAKLQMTGSSVDHDRHVLRGDIASGAFSVFYFKGNKLIGVDSVNRPADHLVSRKLLAAGTEIPDGMIEDIEQNLKVLL